MEIIILIVIIIIIRLLTTDRTITYRSSNKNNSGNSNNNNEFQYGMPDWRRKKIWLEKKTGQVYRQKSYLSLKVTSAIPNII